MGLWGEMVIQMGLWVKIGVLDENDHAKGLLGYKWGSWGKMAVQRDFRVKMGF